MARTPNGVGPVQTAQVIFMIDPEVAGRVEAWRQHRGLSNKSEQYREIFLAGLKALEPRWTRKHGEPHRSSVAAAVASAPRGKADGPAAGAVAAAGTGAGKPAKPVKRAADRKRVASARQAG